MIGIIEQMFESRQVVVRGDALDPAVLRADATRFARRYPQLGWLGVSAFYAAGDSEVDALCQAKFERFAEVVVFRSWSGC